MLNNIRRCIHLILHSIHLIADRVGNVVPGGYVACGGVVACSESAFVWGKAAVSKHEDCAAQQQVPSAQHARLWLRKKERTSSLACLFCTCRVYPLGGCVFVCERF